MNIKTKDALQSHPLRVRGLKPFILSEHDLPNGSHPLRVRGLKPMGHTVTKETLCRILYGCVD